MRTLLLLTAWMLTIPSFGQDHGACGHWKNYDQAVLKQALSESSTATTVGKFSVSFSGLTTEQEEAFLYAARIWDSILTPNVRIDVNVGMINLGAGVLGVTIPSSVINFPNAPLTDRWYMSPLAEHLAETELNTNVSDIDIFFNPTIPWHLDTLTDPNNGEYDFATIAIHELGHGLGFLSVTGIEDDNTGSFGMIDTNIALPLTIHIQELDSLPGVFDSFFENGTFQQLTDTSIFANPSLELASQFTSNAVQWRGQNGMLAHGGFQPRIYSPSTWESGPSLNHLDESIYASGSENSLMTPTILTGEKQHSPGPIVLGMLKDIGWLNATSVDELDQKSELAAYPNPANNVLHIEATEKLMLVNTVGQFVMNIPQNTGNVSTRELPNGAYFLLGETKRKKIMVRH